MTAPVKHVWIALAVVYVVWGSTYFGIKIAVETIPPLLAAGSRFLVAGLLVATILALRGTSLRIARRELGGAAIVGGLLLGLGVGLVHVAETRIDSSVDSLSRYASARLSRQQRMNWPDDSGAGCPVARANSAIFCGMSPGNRKEL